MLVVHGTKKLLDRLGSAPRQVNDASTTALGSWYATALFRRPQVALFVNEATLLPVLVPLAPAATVIDRFAPALGAVLAGHQAPDGFIDAEMAEMAPWRVAKTANRSVVGIMNEFAYLGQVWGGGGDERALLRLSMRLAEVPCGPLYSRHGSPDRELAAFLSQPRA